MNKTYLISQTSSFTILILISFAFAIIGIYYSKKFKGINNYLTANRSVGLFSLTTSLTASALGAWILFGPASAATWGGLGSIIGYSLGTAFPMFILIYLGKKIRKEFPQGSSLIEFMRKKFGKSFTPTHRFNHRFFLKCDCPLNLRLIPHPLQPEVLQKLLGA